MGPLVICFRTKDYMSRPMNPLWPSKEEQRDVNQKIERQKNTEGFRLIHLETMHVVTKAIAGCIKFFQHPHNGSRAASSTANRSIMSVGFKERVLTPCRSRLVST